MEVTFSHAEKKSIIPVKVDTYQSRLCDRSLIKLGGGKFPKKLWYCVGGKVQQVI